MEEMVKTAALHLGDASRSDEDVERLVLAVAKSHVLARRLIDWLPEVFALVLIGHSWKVGLPKHFTVRNSLGEWEAVAFKDEPIVAVALCLATHVYHNGPRDQFKRIVSRSALLNTINNALNSGANIEGAQLGDLKMFGIGAEVYHQ